MTSLDRHTAPARAGSVLFVLILVASVANLNLAVANVALPEIGRDFDASQTQLNLIAVAYSLGLAGSVLYLGALGALGDRYGRKLLLVLGMALSIPACVIAGFAPNFEVLFGARLLGGLSAGLAYPTTLALITALWAGAPRTKAIALWSALGGAMSALGPLLSGALLEKFQWGSVFLVTSPLTLLALILAAAFVPGHVNETTDPVDNFGGIVSVVFIAALVLGINFAPVDGMGTVALGLGAIALAAGAVFVVRQSRASFPLFDLKIARRRTFWVAALAGIIVFGSLMGVIFVGQQFLQNVLGYSTLAAGASTLPAAVAMVLVAPQSAKLVERRGSRFTLLLGYVFIVLGLVLAWLTWKEDVSYAVVAISYVLLGIGVGLAGTPASRSLTGSVPVDRAGMASGTADLQRDLGGAIMQSTLGALLTAGYAASLASQISSSPDASGISAETQSVLTKSFSSATDLASSYPQYADQIIGAAEQAFLDGDQMSYAAAIVVVLVGAVLVFFAFPGRDEEKRLLAQYHSIDAGRSATPIDEPG